MLVDGFTLALVELRDFHSAIDLTPHRHFFFGFHKL